MAGALSRGLAGAALFALSACGLVLGIEDRRVDDTRVSSKDSGGNPGGGDGDTADDDDSPATDAGVVGDTAAPPPVDGGDPTSRYRAAVLADTPALYFRFGEAAGATTLRNEVVGVTATYPATGVTRSVPGALAGDPDTAISFDNGMITVPPSVDLNGLVPCAIEFWTKRDATQSGIGFLLDHQVWTGKRHGWDVETENDFVTYERYTTTGSKLSTGTSTKTGLSLGVWHHWVATFDGSRAQVFVDGGGRQSTAGVDMASTGGQWFIGGAGCTTCDNHLSYKGSLDELAIYTHTLTETQIAAHFAAAH